MRSSVLTGIAILSSVGTIQPQEAAGPKVMGQIQEESSIELWFEPGRYGASQSQAGALVEDYNLQIRNMRQSPILMIAFRLPCPGQPDSEEGMEFCGTTEIYFHYGGPDASIRAPVEPGELRSFPWVRYASGTTDLYLDAVLFADGKSVGVREPYASKYLDALMPSVRYYDSLQPKARQALSEERRTRLEKKKEIADAIMAESLHQASQHRNHGQ